MPTLRKTSVTTLAVTLFSCVASIGCSSQESVSGTQAVRVSESCGFSRESIRAAMLLQGFDPSEESDAGESLSRTQGVSSGQGPTALPDGTSLLEAQALAVKLDVGPTLGSLQRSSEDSGSPCDQARPSRSGNIALALEDEEKGMRAGDKAGAKEKTVDAKKENEQEDASSEAEAERERLNNILQLGENARKATQDKLMREACAEAKNGQIPLKDKVGFCALNPGCGEGFTSAPACDNPEAVESARKAFHAALGFNKDASRIGQTTDQALAAYDQAKEAWEKTNSALVKEIFEKGFKKPRISIENIGRDRTNTCEEDGTLSSSRFKIKCVPPDGAPKKSSGSRTEPSGPGGTQTESTSPKSIPPTTSTAK